MTEIPEDLHQLLKHHGQDHTLAFWPHLTPPERAQLVEQLQSINLEELTSLYARREETYPLPDLKRLRPLPRPDVSSPLNHERGLAENALRRGEIAFLVVAGGQGSRLGFEKPKGMYPIGPVTGRSLFHLFAQQILALRRRYQAALPFLVMTSPATHADTVRFFHEQHYFGLLPDDVWFFQQGTMPALDLETGKLLLEDRSRLFLSPNGHGGTLTGLASSGLLKRLMEQGIRTVYYFQVDNPLLKLADLPFLGRHLAQDAEVSTKVLAKQDPLEKVGNFVLLDGRLGIIEYSDLKEGLARQKDESGKLFFWAGNPAIHLFDVPFLHRLSHEAESIPWHVARKKVPHLDVSGRQVQPEENNALKFERFIFDVLPRAERWSITPILRAEEFEPLKNMTGPESPETVRQALIDQGARWLERAGVKVPRNDRGKPTQAIEIHPLFALDGEELAAKHPKVSWDGPVLLE